MPSRLRPVRTSGPLVCVCGWPGWWRLQVCTLVLSSLPKQKTSNEDIKEAPAALKTLILFTSPNLTAEIPPLAKEQQDVGRGHPMGRHLQGPELVLRPPPQWW